MDPQIDDASKVKFREGLARSPVDFIVKLQENNRSETEKLFAEHGCLPALHALKMLDVKESDVVKLLLTKLLQRTVDSIPNQSQEKKNEVLKKSFNSFHHPILSQIPLKTMQHLASPSADILEQITQLNDESLLKIPPSYRTMIWEKDEKRFSSTILSLINSYISDYGNLAQTSDWLFTMKTRIPKERRNQNKALQKLRQSIDKSSILYFRTVQTIHKLYKKSRNPALCSLRSDLVMTFHDFNVGGITSRDTSHQLAWYLDATYKKISASNLFSDSLATTVEKNTRTLLQQFESISAVKDEVSSDEEVDTNKVIKLTTFEQEVQRVIDNVKREDVHQLFWRPVIQNYPALKEQYRIICPKPMDLQTISSKLKKRQYLDMEQVRADLFQIHKNSLAFNGPDHQITEIAAKLMRVRGKVHLDKAIQRLKDSRRYKMKLSNQNGLTSTLSPKERVTDALMILKSRHNRSSLAIFIFSSLWESTFEKKMLPRKNDTLRNLLFFMKASNHMSGLFSSHGTTKSFLDDFKKTTSKHSLLMKKTIPSLLLIMTRNVEVRNVSSFHMNNTKMTSIDSTSFTSLIEKYFVQSDKSRNLEIAVELFGFHMLERIRVRDVEFLRVVYDFLSSCQEDEQVADVSKTVRYILLTSNGFTHAISTAYFDSSLNNRALPYGASIKTILKKPVFKNKPAKFSNYLPKLTVIHYNRAVERFLIPKIFLCCYKMHKARQISLNEEVGFTMTIMMRKIELQNEGITSKNEEFTDHCLALADLGRFLNLPSTLQVLKSQDIFMYAKVSLLSLVDIFSSNGFLPETAEMNISACEFVGTVNSQRIKDISGIKSLAQFSGTDSDYLNQLYQWKLQHPSFRRAAAYFGALFDKFPTLKSHCLVDSTTQLKPYRQKHRQTIPGHLKGRSFTPSPFPLTPSADAFTAGTPTVVMSYEDDSASE